MIKVMTVFGTRPEAIKMCPLISSMKKNSILSCCVCLTGQHQEMLSQVMNIFNIKEDYNFKIMKTGQTLTAITTEILNAMSNVIKREKPSMILVHGDTTTSFAASIAAYYEKIPIGHVEAGLRTYNLYSPYPEEFNRQVVDIIAELYFAPTICAKQNLLREGKKEEQIFVTGNTVIDSLATTVIDNYKSEYLEWSKNSKLILLTAHRRENLGNRMHGMFKAIRRIVELHDDVKILYPVHLNPIVQEVAENELGNCESIRLIDPLNVLDFHNLMAKSYLILTDSGGIQEEATSLGKPVLVMRDTTERPEGIVAGTLKLVGTEEKNIFAEIQNLLTDKNEYNSMSHANNPYGDGHASERIIDAIIKYFKSMI